jgi:DNA-binding SARP family transcriptional activator
MDYRPTLFHDRLRSARAVYDLTLLGTLTLAGPGGRPGGRVMQRRRLTLLAILGIVGPRGVRRERLMSLLWPDADEQAARHLLSDSIHVIRRELGQQAIAVSADELRLNVEIVRCDVVTFEKWLAAGDLERGVAAYGGALLDGFCVGGPADLEQWLDGQRSRLARRYADALLGLAAEAEIAGDPILAIPWLRRLAAAEPFDTDAAIRLVRLLNAAGDAGGAARHARMHQELLREELGVEAGPALAAALTAALGAARSTAPRTVEHPPAAAAPIPPAPPHGVPVAMEASVGIRPTVARRSRMLRRPALAAAACVFVVLVVGWFALDRRPPAGQATGKVAVFPFTVTGVDPGRMGEVVHVLLAARIDGSGLAPAVEAGTGGNPLPRDRAGVKRAAAVAASLGATSFVMGDVVVASGHFEVSAVHYSDAKRPRHAARAVADGAPEEIFQLVDRIAAQLLVATSGADAPLVRTAALTTSSLPALKRFIDGERAYRAGRLDAAAAAYADAIVADTTFALAYHRLSIAQEWSGLEDRGRAAAAAASARADRLPPRARQLLEANAARRAGDFTTAERLFRALLQRYPDDADGWNGLGEVLFHGNPPRGRSGRDAREPFERARALGLRSAEPVFHLVSIAAAEERLDAVDTLSRHYLAAPAEPLLAAVVRAQRVLLLDERTADAELVAGLNRLSLNDALFAVQIAASSTYRLGAADRLLDQLQVSGASAAQHSALARLRAYLAAGRGRWDDVEAALARLQSLDRAAAVESRARLLALQSAVFPPDRLEQARLALLAQPYVVRNPVQRLYLAGRLLDRNGRADSALACAAELDTLPGDSARARAAVLRALAERRSGSLQRALDQLEPALAAAGGADFRLLRGELLIALGWHQEALAWLSAAEADMGSLPLLGEIAEAFARAHQAGGTAADALIHERRARRLREGR